MAAVTAADPDWPRSCWYAINPCAAAPWSWVSPAPPPQTARVPAGPCSAAARVGVSPAGSPPALPAQSSFVGPVGGWLGAKRRVENLVSVSAGREGEHRAAPPPLPGQWRLPQPAPTSPPSPGVCTLPPFPLLNPHPALRPIPLISQSLGTLPHTSRLPLFPSVSLPTPAPLTLTHLGAIFRPPSLQSCTSPILGSFPRQPWPSLMLPEWVGGCVCMWRAGKGIWGHRGGEPRRGPGQGGEWWAAGAGCLLGSINGP